MLYRIPFSKIFWGSVLIWIKNKKCQSWIFKSFFYLFNSSWKIMQPFRQHSTLFASHAKSKAIFHLKNKFFWENQGLAKLTVNMCLCDVWWKYQSKQYTTKTFAHHHDLTACEIKLLNLPSLVLQALPNDLEKVTIVH